MAIKILNNDDRELLKSKTALSLPDNPSNKGLSSSQIKSKLADSSLMLFNWTVNLQTEVNEYITSNDTNISTIQSNITSLGDRVSALENGVSNIAERAYSDANGNNIASTYETKEDATSKYNSAVGEVSALSTALGSGTTIVNRAQCDKDGIDITTYGKSLASSTSASPTGVSFTITLNNKAGVALDSETISLSGATVMNAGLLVPEDKIKIMNISSNIGTALASAKSYTDDKVARANLISVLGEASTSLNGLMSSTDKARLDALYELLGESTDEDSVVNTINEILAIFDNYPEGTTIVNALATKVNTSDIINNLTSDETTKPLSAYQGKVLKGLVDNKADTSSLASVATSGSYEDLSNKPTIPSLSGYATETWVKNNFPKIYEGEPTTTLSDLYSASGGSSGSSGWGFILKYVKNKGQVSESFEFYLGRLESIGGAFYVEFEKLASKKRYASSSALTGTTTLNDIIGVSTYAKPYALDEDVVKLSGNQTINGSLTVKEIISKNPSGGGSNSLTLKDDNGYNAKIHYGGYQIMFQPSQITLYHTTTPSTTNSYDLGSSSLMWKDVYVAGTVKTNAIEATGGISVPTGDISIGDYGTTFPKLIFKGANNGRTVKIQAENYKLKILAGTVDAEIGNITSGVSTTEYYYSFQTTRPLTNNTFDLGASSYQWKDLYLAGNLSDGTNSISVADIVAKQNALTAGSGIAISNGVISANFSTLDLPTNIEAGTFTNEEIAVWTQSFGVEAISPYTITYLLLVDDIEDSENPAQDEDYYITPLVLYNFVNDSFNKGANEIISNLSSVAFSGDYSSLSNTPSLATVATSGSYNDLSNKPTIPTVPTNVSSFTNDAGYLTSHQDISGKANVATTLSGYGITDAYTKTEIDGKLSGAMHYKGTVASSSNLPVSSNVQGDMYNVTDTGANYAWNGSSWDKLSENIDLSGLQTKITSTNKLSYTLLSDTPTIPDAQIQADWNQTTTTAKDYIKNKPTIPNAQIQSDWTQSNSSALDYIKNKPTLFSGSYTDLTNKPTIPTKVSDLTNDSNFATQSWITNKGYYNGQQVLEVVQQFSLPVWTLEGTETLANIITTGEDSVISRLFTYGGLHYIGSVYYNKSTTDYNFEFECLGTKDRFVGANVAGTLTFATIVGGNTYKENYVIGSDLATVATSGSYADLSNKPTIPTYESKTASNGGTAESLCTTGEKYTWNSKQAGHATLTSISGLSTSSTGLVKLTNGTASLDTTSYLTSHRYRPIQVNGTSALANTSSSALNLVAGNNVALSNNSGSITISATNTTYSAGTGIDITSNVIKSTGVEVLTTAPSSNNTSGLKFVVLSSEPATKYDGYFYIITSSNS